MTQRPRTRRRPWTAVGLAVLAGVGAVAVALAGCGGPRGVTLTELAHNAPDYDGREVVVSGVVREFGGEGESVPRHFVLQDADSNRVQLLPDDAAQPHVGSAVRVVGTFAFDEDTGRRLVIEEIDAAAP